MNTRLIFPCASAALLALTGCIVPPSMFERASWGPPEDWQGGGRYRQTPGEEEAEEPAEQAVAKAPRTSPTTSRDPLLEGQDTVAPDAAPVTEPPLYAWDGGVVDGAPQGRVASETGAPRGLETPPAGRMHIIELYQQVLDERDALADEVERLRKHLEETSVALETETRESSDLAARVAALEAGHKDLLADNQAIAARLVQAQIRRLEAEKLLLETRIEVERAKAEEAALAAAAAQARPSTARPKTPKKPDDESAGGDHE